MTGLITFPSRAWPASLRHAAFITAALILPATALAQSASPEDQEALIAELQEKLREQEARLEKLEQLIAQPSPESPTSVQSASDPAPERLAPHRAAASPAAPVKASPLKVSGDMRLRYEHNNTVDGQRNDSRGAFRGRVAAVYKASPGLKFGARLVTGDPDNPNSSDVSLSNFNDDLKVSLDQLYGMKSFGSLTVMGGKFPNPFRRTDLVWDGDVNPQGVAAQYAAIDTGSTQIGASALLFPIERSVGGPDSKATGYQLTLDHQPADTWSVGLAAGYYDYEIEATDTADAGDTRTNLLDASGTYISDFDLLDIIADLSYTGLGERWPISLQAEYVQNYGADAHDTGYSFSTSFGRTEAVGEYSFGYGYNVAEADAVFAAFAQDNIPYASNYRQHALSFTYALSDQLDFNTTLYSFRLKDVSLVPFGNTDWQQRLRINLVAHF
ncbi:putative porin [Henriciella sp.]|uniref:putative porin n=1 Tax=Henriciella sp. TaxID=1968823 RepID=UPI002604E90E|nr:putative porin [Henriciella sp.]